ncbi:MAG: EamA family transporter RarD [Alphaproteobacteria bacterium]|nr:MAG: EamA family transporter RarD [Alphaproteobacteria bacterium]
MSETREGILAVVGAGLIWGLSPLYYKLLAHVPPLEVLSHRTLWSLAFFGAVLAVQGRLALLARLILSRRIVKVVPAAALISVNWFLFIHAVQTGRGVEASLGYYILPLVVVLLGVVVVGERLGRPQALAVALAALAVTTLSLGLGVAPVVPLALAFSFGLYALIKRGVSDEPTVSVTGEVAVLAPLAALWLWGVHSHGWTGIVGRSLATFGNSLSDSLLLMLSGPLTALPLILFSYASRRASMATVGLVQYLNPTLQLLCATLVFGEAVTPWHAVALPVIWVALAIYAIDGLRQGRASRSSASSTAAEGATPT